MFDVKIEQNNEYFWHNVVFKKKERKIIFKVGENVLHPRHGIGTVKAVEEKEFAGVTARMAVLFFDRGGLKMLVPSKKLADSVRAPIGEQQARDVIDFIRNWDGKLSTQWKVRKSKNQERLESGDPFEVSQVYKGLRNLRSKRGELNTHDRRQLAAAHEILLGELAYALPETEEVVEKHLETACSGETVAA